MSLNERIERLEADLRFAKDQASDSTAIVKRIETDLAALKAEASAPKPLTLWVPKDGEPLFSPSTLGNNYYENRGLFMAADIRDLRAKERGLGAVE